MKMKGGGGTESFGVVLTRELEVLAILKGVQNIFTLSKFYSVLRGGGGFSSPLRPSDVHRCH